MKLYEFTKINLYVVLAALVISILPIYGLLSETAISVGMYGANYEAIDLKNNPQHYWFIIKVEWYVVLWTFTLSFIRFPIIESAQKKISRYRKEHKIIFLLVAFLMIPIIATALIILIMAILQ